MVELRKIKGGLAQLARAFAWHARGHRFDSDILHLGSAFGRFFLINSWLECPEIIREGHRFDSDILHLGSAFGRFFLIIGWLDRPEGIREGHRFDSDILHLGSALGAFF